MSFLPGRMAATENAYFREQSKAAVKVLREKIQKTDPEKLSSAAAPSATSIGDADVLPEILMHTLPKAPPGLLSSGPAKLSQSAVPKGSSLAGLSQSIMKQFGKTDGPQIPSLKGSANDVVQLFSPSVPSEATFGPRRWMVEHTPGSQPVPSTANAARLDAEPYVDPPTQEEVRQGMLEVAKAFGVATTLVFGGGAVAIAYVGYRLDWRSSEDVRTKTRAAVLPLAESMRQWFKPAQSWALQKGEKWKLEERERRALGIDFAQALGVQASEQTQRGTGRSQA